MAKKLVSFCLLAIIILFPSKIYAACNPTIPNNCLGDAVTNPAESPDVNIELRRGGIDWNKITGTTNLISGVSGPTDPNAPRIYTMFTSGTQNNLSPTSIYQLHDWDWGTNSIGGLMTPPALEVGGNSIPAASLFGFNVGSGQSVLVPQANYDIGQGYQAILEYVTPTSAVVKYTPSADLTGNYYMIHFEDMAVSQDLIKAYNDAKKTGELVWLPAGFELGLTTGELKVAMRDSGAFMDLRSQKDWWQNPLGSKNNVPTDTKISKPAYRNLAEVPKCWTKIDANYPDETGVVCPGDNCGGVQMSGILPKYYPAKGASVPEMRTDAGFQWGVGVRGLSCGQARSDSFSFIEVAPYDLFEKKDPDLCENDHAWTGQTMTQNINIPFAQDLATHWAGKLDAEHYTEDQLKKLFALAASGGSAPVSAPRQFPENTNIPGQCVPLQASVELVSVEPVNYALVVKRTSCAPEGTLGNIRIYTSDETGFHADNMTGSELRFLQDYPGAGSFMPKVNSLTELANIKWKFNAPGLGMSDFTQFYFDLPAYFQQNSPQNNSAAAAAVAMNKIWQETGVLKKLLPQESQDELKADFIRYVQSKGGNTLYAGFAILGQPLVTMTPPPDKPVYFPGEDSNVSMAKTAEYRQKLQEWILSNNYRPILDLMGLFPNEAAKGQIKTVLCRDRGYQEMSPPYPETMKMGLAANQLFRIMEPMEAQAEFYKKEPSLKDPILTLTKGVVPLAYDDQGEIKNIYAESSPQVVATTVKNKNIFQNIWGKIVSSFGIEKEDKVFAAPPAPPAGGSGCFHLEITSNAYETGSGKVKIDSLVNFVSDNGGDGHVRLNVDNTDRITNSVFNYKANNGVYSVYPEWTNVELTPDANGQVTLNFEGSLDNCGKEGLVTVSATCVFRPDANGIYTSDNCKGGKLYPPAGPGFCNPEEACCVTTSCEPKVFPRVQFGPPYTQYSSNPPGLDHQVYGVEWNGSSYDPKEVQLIFKKEDWRDYSDKTSLPGECTFANTPAGSSCNQNSDCPGWGDIGGMGCKAGQCKPFTCTHSYTRTADIYSVMPYGWSTEEVTISDCVGRCVAQNGNDQKNLVSCQLSCNAYNKPSYVGFFNLLKPALPEQLTKKNPYFGRVFDEFGNFIPTPGAAKTTIFNFRSYLAERSSGTTGTLRGPKKMTVTLGNAAGQQSGSVKNNLLFYRLGGVCNANKLFSEIILNPATSKKINPVCGTLVQGSGLGGISPVALPDMPKVNACKIIQDARNIVPNDTGRCVHFAANGGLLDGALRENIARMQQMGITQALVPYNPDENNLARYAAAFQNQGIMPIWRPLLTPDQNYQANSGWGRDVDILIKAGFKDPIIQMFNEPWNPAEWGGNEPDEAKFLENLANGAVRIYQAGGLIGLQAMDGQELSAELAALRAVGGDKILNRVVVIPHLYSATGRTPASTGEYSIIGQLTDIENALKAEGIPNTPIIAGEGGFKEMEVGYDLQKQAQYTKEVYDWFAIGKMSNGETLPSNFFGLCMWNLTGVGASSENVGGSWFDNTTEKNAGGGTEKTNITNLLQQPAGTRANVECPPDPVASDSQSGEESVAVPTSGTTISGNRLEDQVIGPNGQNSSIINLPLRPDNPFEY